MESTIFQNIANLGFPIAITVYLLVRMETKIEKLSTSIDSLNVTIKKWTAKKRAKLSSLFHFL